VEDTRAKRHTRWMRTFLILLVIALLALVVAGWWKYSSLYPKSSQETVQLNAEKRHALTRLRDERKFEPHDYPPLGYTGIATPEEGVVARAAVNDVIGSLLSREDGPIAAKPVSELIGRGMKRVDQLETEDRDRTADYMIEIWYLLGFNGATGRFGYGASFQRPEGYGEPLPPGGNRRRSHVRSANGNVQDGGENSSSW
jgi:hypothetical protein